MTVPTTIADLSTTAADNAPQGHDSPDTLDNIQRAHGAFIKQLSTGTGFAAGNLAGITPGTGIATALAVAVGTDGAPVIKGGALGTPSSGSAANLTSFPTLNQNTSGTAAGLSGTPNISVGTLSATSLLDLSGAAAGQIKFPATQNASADANTLDDYEEGTWTPSPTAGSGTITTVGTKGGSYTKVGNVVSVWGRVAITDAGTGTGQLDISGLPFSSGAPTGINHFTGAGFNLASFKQAVTWIASNTGTISMWQYDQSTVIVSGQGATFFSQYTV